MSEVIIYGPPASSYLRTVRMTCVEKNVSYELRPVDFGGESHRALHPFLKVPILEHKNLRIYESSAITRYLDATFTGGSLIPGDRAEAARMEQWISVLNCYLYDDLIRNYVLQYVVPRGPNKTPDRAVIDVTLPKVDRHLALLDQALAGRKYFAAENLSLADLFYAPVLISVAMFPEGKAAIDKHSNVKNFLGRMMERPSFREANPPPPSQS